MVPRTSQQQIVERVRGIYQWLDNELLAAGLAGKCSACGNCCHFRDFGHRLFVTTPELLYFSLNVKFKPLQVSANRCPYQLDDKCTVHPIRFAGCRIFHCDGDAEVQAQLSEKVLRKFKSLCEEFNLEYRYADLAAALSRIWPGQ